MRQNLPFQIATLAAAIALTACGGDSGSSSKNSGLANKDAGTATISAQGANGTNNAGNGGNVEIAKSYGPGDLNISVNGTPDTDYELPEYTVNLGPKPLTISSSVTIKKYSGGELATGELYILYSNLFQYDGAKDSDGDQVVGKPATVITGVEIAAGATVTLATNDDRVYLYLANDLVNNGIITTANILAPDTEDTDARPDLEITAVTYSGSGSFDLTGFSADYPHGRDLELYARIIANGGSINTSGYSASEEDATSGGNAGDAEINAYLFVENTGTITANGGNSVLGYAGQAGDIDLSAKQTVINTASLSANNGTGANANNGSYGHIEMESLQTLINTGNISALGASATDPDGSSSGGQGGRVELYTYPAELTDALAEEAPRFINTGAINVSGGKTNADSQSGRGGNISLGSYESQYGAEGMSNPAMVAISGSLIANGGGDSSSYYGGNGGSIEIDHYSTALSELPTQIVGYSSINVSGGSANSAAGAGSIDISSRSTSDTYYGSYLYAAAAPVAVETDLTANGGNAIYNAEASSSGNAGSGGLVRLNIYVNNNVLQEEITDAELTFSGNISLNGGSATGFAAEDVDFAYGGEGGRVALRALHGITAEGAMSANGGATDTAGSDSTGYYGGSAGNLEAISSQGAIDLALDFTLNGGSGANAGGNGGSVLATAAGKVTIDGDISATGANADANILNSMGGFGGQITAYSVADKYRLNDEAVLTAGTGNQAAWAGGVQQGGTCIVGNCSVMMEPK